MLMTKFERLKKRSQFLHDLRAFFYERAVIEVDTPILSQAATPDLHLRSLRTTLQIPGEGLKDYYLHTSPEYPMKRLLCEGVEDCFYLGKVFRDSDLSPRHQIEFSMLEWYRLGFDLQQLIDEVVALIQARLSGSETLCDDVEQLTYRETFTKYAQIDDICSATAANCREVLLIHKVPEIVGVELDDKVLWEQLVLTEVIEPQLGKSGICVINDFPARDAALARVSTDNPQCAQRFEVFVKGMELANGYYELADANEYRQRFEASLAMRKEQGLPPVVLDENLLADLEQKGLPDCSGVALGVDRLFALQQGLEDISEGIAFGIKDA